MWHLFEYPEVYDGWILQFNFLGQIKWRDIPAVKNLSKKKKKEIENFVSEIIKMHAN